MPHHGMGIWDNQENLKEVDIKAKKNSYLGEIFEHVENWG